MIDAVDPAHIAAGYNGQLAMRISVFADPAAETMDLEAGNVGATSVAIAAQTRQHQGRWTVGYVNESTLPELVAALSARSVPLLDAGRWPATGAYLWCADPNRKIAAGTWKPPVSPVAVQDTYAGLYDLSTPAPGWPVVVAGYLDGPQSAWPAAAWTRFTIIDSRTPAPEPTPEEEPMPGQIVSNPDGTVTITGNDKATGDLLVLKGTPGSSTGWQVINVTAAVKAENPSAPLYQLD